MNEAFPMLCGVAVGVLLGVLRPAVRLRVGAGLAVVLGVLATVVSGEFRIGGEYLLIDIPLVALSAAVSFTFARSARGSAGALHDPAG